MNRRLLLTATAVTALTSGCAAPRIGDYADEKPTLDLRSYFNGTLDAYGIFTDRAGKVVKRFTVVMHCSWQGDEGVLDEHFRYADGTTQRRVWHLRHEADGRYTGRADDVVGGASGQVRGNTFHWTYTLALPVGASADSAGRIVDVELDDWMYLMDARVMLNKATMSKFGVRLGEVTLTFVKRHQNGL